MFDPYDTSQFIVTPFENVEWGPTAYNPTLNSIVVCAVDTRARAWAQVPKASQTLVPGVSGVGILGRTSPTTTPRAPDGARRAHEQAHLAQRVAGPVHRRVDQHGLEPDLRRHHRRQVGQGTLQALDTATGRLLWESPPMDAMATAPPVTYSVGGKQYVSILVGGQNRDDPTGGVCSIRSRAAEATTSTRSPCRRAFRGGGRHPAAALRSAWASARLTWMTTLGEEPGCDEL